jgi:hypothetical protein
VERLERRAILETMSNPITTATIEPNVEPDTESGTNTAHAELTTAAPAMQ